MQIGGEISRAQSSTSVIRERKIVKRNTYGLDFISSLPDDIIIYIFSFLGMKEAGRTSILSKRWRYVWTKLVDLNFDAMETLLNLHHETVEDEISKYVEWVNQVVHMHNAPYINTFRVHFILGERHRAHIDKWVEFAIKNGVRKLVLDLSNFCGGCGPNLYTFNYRFCSLPSMRPNIQYVGFVGWNTLESLCLVGVNTPGSLLEFILSNCLNLRRLSVSEVSNFGSLKVSGSSLKLKRLELFCCYDIKRLEICAQSLSSILFWGQKINVEYRSAPSLVEACFGGLYGCHLIKNIDHIAPLSSQLEKLSLSFNEICYLPTGCPSFANVKQLELGVMCKDGDSLLYLTSYINACTLLHKFKLKITWSEWIFGPVLQPITETQITEHQHLKVVEIVGFDGARSDVKFTLHLMNFALTLEKIILDTRCPVLMGQPNQLLTNKDLSRFEDQLYSSKDLSRFNDARTRAAQLAEQIPSRVVVDII